MPSSDELIGLFPLQLVLLPGEILPLHIFEDRYKKLIAECRAEDGVFGVVMTEDEEAAERGCTAAVYEVVEEFEDGRLNILVEGRERFRIEEVVEPDDPEVDFLRARVVVFEDIDDQGDGPTEELVEAASNLFRRMIGLMGVDDPRVPRSEDRLSFRLAAAVDFGLPLKQRLLESRSETERLEVLVAVMNALIPGLELRKQREEAIRGNGKGY
jgi:Lon protease-like protein